MLGSLSNLIITQFIHLELMYLRLIGLDGHPRPNTKPLQVISGEICTVKCAQGFEGSLSVRLTRSSRDVTATLGM